MNPEKIEQRKLAMEVAHKVTRDKNFKLVDYMQYDSKNEINGDETEDKELPIGSSLN